MSESSRVQKALFPTPQDAEAAFYEALTKGDLEAMMAVWADDDEVYCVHPNGARVTGVDQVRESWRQIFASGQTAVVSSCATSSTAGDDALGAQRLRAHRGRRRSRARARR